MNRRCARAAAAISAVAAAIALAGCTGSGHDAATPPATHGSSAAAKRVAPNPKISPPPSFAGVQHALPSGKALANDPELYKHAALTGCAATAHGWKGSGTLANTGNHAITATVVVLFTDAQARDVDSASATVDVAPGKTGKWTAARKFAAPSGTRCVLRAVHTT